MLVSGQAEARQGPGFDCSKTHHPLATLICHDDELSQIDLSLNQAYNGYRDTLDVAGKARLVQEENVFIRAVIKLCGIPSEVSTAMADEESDERLCVAKTYTERIKELKKRAGGDAVIATAPQSLTSLPQNTTNPTLSETIQLEESHGVYMVPVRINDTITIPFILDTGAADISVPEDVFKTLLRARAVTETDFLAPGTYVNADGLARSKQRFMLHQLRVGDHVVRDIVANVAPDKAEPLLGQSFLGKLPAWTMDNTRHTLVIGSDVPPHTATAEGPPPQPQREPPVATINPPVAPEAQLTVAEILKRANAVRYGFDRNVPQDYAQAMQLFRKVAGQGNAEAQNAIGEMYLKGQGVPQDYTQAMRWYRKAADRGFAEARNNIGYLYAHGLGVPQDCAVATKWTGRVATVLCDLPRVGDCVNATVEQIGTRLGPWDSPTPGSGSAIKFSNGGVQTGYDTVPAIDQSRMGDPVRMCLEEIPQGCPIGDDRGRVYRVTNLRTNQSWSRADASHMCGGA